MYQAQYSMLWVQVPCPQSIQANNKELPALYSDHFSLLCLKN